MQGDDTKEGSSQKKKGTGKPQKGSYDDWVATRGRTNEDEGGPTGTAGKKDGATGHTGAIMISKVD